MGIHEPPHLLFLMVGVTRPGAGMAAAERQRRIAMRVGLVRRAECQINLYKINVDFNSLKLIHQ